MAAGSICILPYIQAVSGPGSFQLKLKTELEKRAIEVHHDASRPGTQAVLLIAGTRHLGALMRARQKGVRIVQRLDGMNWIQRRRRTGLRHFLRAEAGNLLLAYTRRFLADAIVYQSEFTHAWWQRVYGETRCENTVIYNGVDLSAYNPAGPERPPTDVVRLQVIEGHLKGGNEIALEFALGFAVTLERKCGRPVELAVAGDVPARVRAAAASLPQPARLVYQGVVARDQVPALNRGAHALYSAELNAPCPNAVIEALACGTPVLGFDGGSLPELIHGDAGKVVPYGANPWSLQAPDFETLATAALEVLTDQPRFRKGARLRAQEAFSLELMADHYLRVLTGQTNLAG